MQNKLETMKPYFSGRGILEFTPELKLFPWAQPQSQAFESQWIVCKEEFITVEGERYDLIKNMEINEIIEVFRS